MDLMNDTDTEFCIYVFFIIIIIFIGLNVLEGCFTEKTITVYF